MKDFYLSEFQRILPSLPGLREIRSEAIERFSALGFPTGREEAWRFTDVSPMTEIPFRPAEPLTDAREVEALGVGAVDGTCLTFVNGRYEPRFSSPCAGARRLALADDAGPHARYLGRLAGLDGHPFAALNTAFASDGAFVTETVRPVHLVFVTSSHGEPVVTYPRILVVVPDGAKATIVESYLGPSGVVYCTNAVTELFLGDNAVVDYIQLQRESKDAFHFSRLQARQGRGSVLRYRSISLGAGLARTDSGTILDGEGAECSWDGLYEIAGKQHVDHHTTLDHARPNTTSRELFKGVLDDRARGVFDGRIVVRPDAQKTSAVQTNKNLLLSKDAMVNTKPQLEIFANDVKCKHGATIGQLDRDVLFYLRSRGIGLEEARRLLIHAFASEIVDRLGVDSVRAQVGGCLFARVPSYERTAIPV